MCGAPYKRHTQPQRSRCDLKCAPMAFSRRCWRPYVFAMTTVRRTHGACSRCMLTMHAQNKRRPSAFYAVPRCCHCDMSRRCHGVYCDLFHAHLGILQFSESRGSAVKALQQCDRSLIAITRIAIESVVSTLWLSGT